MLMAATSSSKADISEVQQQELLKQIAASEYAIRWVPELGSYTCPNRANNLRFTFDQEGFMAEPRVPDTDNSWQVTFSLAAHNGEPTAAGGGVRTSIRRDRSLRSKRRACVSSIPIIPVVCGRILWLKGKSAKETSGWTWIY
jgi:hypothetical protein